MHSAIRLMTWVAIASALTATASATAVSDANKRADHYYVSAGKTFNMHANDHARMLGKYARASSEPVPAEVVKEHAAAIRANVTHAQKQYASLAASAQSKPGVAKQLAEIQKCLARVSKQVATLEGEKDVDAKLVISATDAITADLKATHDASKEVDQALNNVIERENSADEFENRDSSSYYFTGEGHFID